MDVRSIIRDTLHREPLNEVHYSMLYHDQFESFRKKYSKLVRDGRASSLYVQFHSVKGDPIDRTPVAEPTHSDMVAVYAYPVDYVVKHPADIWYGQNARYLRVLQAVDREGTLYLTGMRESLAESLLFQMGLNPDDLRRARRIFRHTGTPNQWAKSFMSVVQLKLDEEPESVSWGTPQYKIRSGIEQTRLFLRAGISTLIDSSRNEKGAAINPREPNQIVFLTRAAFRVVEVFNLGGGRPAVSTTWRFDEVSRRVAARVAEVMGDRLVGNAETGGLWGWAYYWTAKGRRIEVLFEVSQEHHRRREEFSNIGGKIHRAHKTYTPHEVSVAVRSEIGEIDISWGEGVKEKEIIDGIAKSWSELRTNPVGTGWEPETHEKYLEKLKKARYDAIKKKVSDEREKIRRDEIQDFKREIADVSREAGVAIPSMDEEEWIDLYLLSVKAGTYIWRGWPNPDYVTRDKESLIRVVDEFKEVSMNSSTDPGRVIFSFFHELLTAMISDPDVDAFERPQSISFFFRQYLNSKRAGSADESIDARTALRKILGESRDADDDEEEFEVLRSLPMGSKGFYVDGDVFAWKVNGMGYPHHDEVAEKYFKYHDIPSTRASHWFNGELSIDSPESLFSDDVSSMVSAYRGNRLTGTVVIDHSDGKVWMGRVADYWKEWYAHDHDEDEDD
jgi:hypothetical protein